MRRPIRSHSRLAVASVVLLLVLLSGLNSPTIRVTSAQPYVDTIKTVLGQIFPALANQVSSFVVKEFNKCILNPDCRAQLTPDGLIQKFQQYISSANGTTFSASLTPNTSPDSTQRLAKLLQETVEMYNNLEHGSQNVTRYYQEIQFESIKDLGGQGFRVITSNDASVGARLAKMLKEKSGVVVGFIGAFDVGKTFIASLICGNAHAQGFGVVTHALAVMAPYLNFPAILLDSAGAQRACAAHLLTDRIITDHFIQEMIIDLSDVIVMVVSSLRVRDQIQIRQLLNRIQHTKKELIIVHNYAHLVDDRDVQNYIKRDITDAFDATFHNFTDLGFTYWQHADQETSRLVRHVVLAHDQGIGKVKYNQDAIKALKMWSGAASAGFGRTSLDVVTAVKDHLNNVLPRYVYRLPPGDRVEEMAPSVTLTQQFANGVSVVVKKAYRWVHSEPTVNPDPTQQTAPPRSTLEVGVFTDPNVTTVRHIRLVNPRPLVYLPSNGIDEMPDAFGSMPIDMSVSRDEKMWLVLIDAPGLRTRKDGKWIPAFEAPGRTLVIRGRKEVHPAYSKKLVDCSAAAASATTKTTAPSASPSTFTNMTSWDSEGPKKRLQLLNDPCFSYQFIRQERKFAPFVVKFDLPDEVDKNAVSIQYINGVLHVMGPFSSYNLDSGFDMDFE